MIEINVTQRLDCSINDGMYCILIVLREEIVRASIVLWGSQNKGQYDY